MTVASKKRSRLFEEVILKSWWTILFFLICFFAYDRGVHYRNKEKQKLVIKMQDLQNEKFNAIQNKELLLLQIESQNEAAWVELMLMRGLGLVPEGEQKIIFLKEPKK